MLLSYAIFTPILLGAATLIFGSDQKAKLTKYFALFSALLTFILTIIITYTFAHQMGMSNTGASNLEKTLIGFHLIERSAWIPEFKIEYFLGVDGISIFLLPLTAFTSILILLSAWKVIEHKINQYYGLFLILTGLTIGAFCALDGILFYLFFEASLLPMYLIIGIWGGKRRVYAAMKFFLYTLVGSVLSLLAMIYLYQQTQSFSILDWQKHGIAFVPQVYLLIAFFLAFAVKVPMWPVHTWLPDAHVEAPTGGSMLLAALMLKLGTYGFFRFILPITPDASHYFAPAIFILSLIAVIYIGLIAMVQTDMKKLVAYSSIAHMGFVTIGAFTFDALGYTGAVVQMISHGFISAGMFFCIGVLYDRVHSREMADYGGVAKTMPRFAVFALILAMANCGLPITSGFVGEIMVLMATVKHGLWLTIAAGLTLILSAAYSLLMYRKVFFGEVVHAHVQDLKDIDSRELLILVLIVFMVFAMGIYPKIFTDLINPAVYELLKHVNISKI